MYCTSLVNYIRQDTTLQSVQQEEHRDDTTWWNGWVVGGKIGVTKSVVYIEDMGWRACSLKQ